MDDSDAEDIDDDAVRMPSTVAAYLSLRYAPLDPELAVQEPKITAVTPAADPADLISPAVSAVSDISLAPGLDADAAADAGRQRQNSVDFFAVAMQVDYFMPIVGPINRLDVLLTIFSFLPAGRTIVRCAAVCQSWRHVIRAVPQWQDTATRLLYRGRELPHSCTSVDAFRQAGEIVRREAIAYTETQNLSVGERVYIHACARIQVFLHWLYFIGIAICGFLAAMSLGFLSQDYHNGLAVDTGLAAGTFFSEAAILIAGLGLHQFIFHGGFCFNFLECEFRSFLANDCPHPVKFGRNRVAFCSSMLLSGCLLVFGPITALGTARVLSLAQVSQTPIWFADCPTASSPLYDFSKPTSWSPVQATDVVSYALKAGPKDQVAGYAAAPTSNGTKWYPGQPRGGPGPSRVYFRNISNGWTVAPDFLALLPAAGTTGGTTVPFLTLLPPAWQVRQCGAQPVLFMTSASTLTSDMKFLSNLVVNSTAPTLMLSPAPLRYFTTSPTTSQLFLLGAALHYAGRLTRMTRGSSSSPLTVPWYLQPGVTSVNGSSPNMSFSKAPLLWNVVNKTMRWPLVTGRPSPSLVDATSWRDEVSQRLWVWMMLTLAFMIFALFLGWLPATKRRSHQCFDADSSYCCCENGVCFLSTLSLRVIGMMAAFVFLNPLTMAIAGGVCFFNGSPWCFMTTESAMLLFIFGMILLCVYAIATIAVCAQA